MKLIKLTNGAIFDAENIAFVLKAGINEYVMVPKVTILPQVPKMDGHEFDELCATMKEEGILVEVKALPRIADDRPKAIATK